MINKKHIFIIITTIMLLLTITTITATDNNTNTQTTNNNHIESTTTDNHIESTTTEPINSKTNEQTTDNTKTSNITKKNINTQKTAVSDYIGHQVILTKTWIEDESSSAKPDSIKVHILVDEQYYTSVTLTSDEGWYNEVRVTTSPTAKITVKEDRVPGFMPYYNIETTRKYNNYGTPNKLFSNEGNIIPVDSKQVTIDPIQYIDTVEIINVPTPTRDYTVSKIWEDADNILGIRPSSVKIHLYNQDSLVETKTLNTNENYVVFENLPVYDEYGNMIYYTVEEDPVPGYTVSRMITTLPSTGSYSDSIILVNTLTPINITVTKKWDDSNNVKGRPYSIPVQLIGNGNVRDTIYLTETDGWKGTFYDIPQIIDGEFIKYTVKEILSDDYNVTITGNQTTGFTINNKQENLRSIKVNKVWMDAGNALGKRPESFTLTLYANNDIIKYITLKQSESWTTTIHDLPIYDDNGDYINYYLKEDEVEGYSETKIEYSEEDSNPHNIQTYYTFTNTLEPINITVIKEWNDYDNYDGSRPYNIWISLLADGKQVDGTYLSDYNGYKHIFMDKPTVSNNNKLINYTIKESYVEGYNSTITGNVNEGFLINNTHIPCIDIPVYKIWEDEDDKIDIRPHNVTINLLANYKIVKSVVMNESDGWHYIFKELPYADKHGKITYNVSEDVLVGYNYTVEQYYDGTFHIINKLIPEGPENPDYPRPENDTKYMNLSVVKAWDDKNFNVIRPEYLRLELYANNKMIDPFKLIASDDYRYTFTNLPVYDNKGNYINYTVREVDTDGNYRVSYYVANGIVIKNSFITEINTTVTKVWTDENNRDGYRPESIKILLYQNGRLYDGATLEKHTGWTHTFKNIPLYEPYSNHKYVYEIYETDSNGYRIMNSEEYDEYYNVTYSGNVTDGFIINNTHYPENRTILLTKFWRDDYNRDGKRPDNLIFTIYANNEPIIDLRVNKDSLDYYIFRSIPDFVKDLNGFKYLYITGIPEFNQNFTPEEIEEYAFYHDYYYNQYNSGYQWEILLFGLPKYMNGSEGIAINYTIRESFENYHNDMIYHLEHEENMSYEDYMNWSIQYKYRYNNYNTNLYYYIENNPGNVSDLYFILNGYTPARSMVKVQKVWEDNENQDNLRPNEIKVQLYANDQPVTYENLFWYFNENHYWYNNQKPIVTLNESNNWYYEWYDLYRYDYIGQEIDYSVREIMDNHILEENGKYNGYTVHYSVGKSDSYSNMDYSYPGIYDNTVLADIYNIHEPEKVNLSVTKLWDDNNDVDGLRPKNVTVQLYNNSKPITSYTYTDNMGRKITVNGKQTLTANRLTYTWIGLPKYYKGNLVNYHIYELNENDSVLLNPGSYNKYYTTSYQVNGYNTIVTNKHVPVVANITVTKTWNDHNNQDHLRPTEIKVQLMADGEEYGKPVVLKGTGNSWTYTFNNLPQYKNGKQVNYYVKEIQVPEGYKATYNGLNIINNHDVIKINISVQKVWYDHENNDGIRPASVNVTLKADGIEVDSVLLTQSNYWEHNFKNLDKFHNGKEIIYSVEEKRVTGYNTKITGNPTSGFTINNSHVPETINISGKKIWDDHNNQDAKRPKTVTIHLIADGQDTKTLTINGTGNTWSFKFENLPKYSNGILLNYTILEYDVPKGYQMRISGFNITNSYTPELTQVDVVKIWNDHHDQDGIRPTRITLHLYANGKQVNTTILNSTNGWKHTFNNLPKYENGTLIKYTINESKVSGYTSKISGYNITNTHIPEETSVLVTKTWNDTNNQDGIRPNYITFDLYANGNIYKAIQLNSTNNWKINITKLPKYENGQLINYSVYETRIPNGYTVSYNGLNIINTHITNKTEVTVVKNWADNHNQDGIRPENITIQLYANGVPKGSPVILNSANNWIHEFKNLDKYQGGRLTNYTIRETSTVQGYTTSITNKSNSYVITNTHTPEKTTVTVNKVWNDNNNQDGIRPTRITLKLLANNELVRTITLNNTNNWKYTFTGLDKYYDGELVNYMVLEDGVPREYTVTYNGTTIVNTHTPHTVEVSVVKDWEDNHNSDGIRPPSIRVQLYANNKASGSPVVLSMSNNWEHIFRNLPKYDNGKIIDYRIDELNVPTGYTKKVGNNSHSFLITNTHTPSVTTVTVTKVWDDNNNQDNLRPTHITIELLANNELYDTITLNNSNQWKYTFKNLPEYSNGRKIVYSVYEYGIPSEYDVTYNGTTIINKHIPHTTEVTVIKSWNDSHNRDNKRPGNVRVQLYADGKAVRSPIVLSNSNNWEYIYEDLPKYDNGIVIRYTVEETGIPEYYENSILYSNNTVIIINTYTPSVTNITVHKVWNDEDNKENIRPESIIVDLFADGELYATRTINGSDDWTYTFTDLPEYDNGKRVNYVVYEVEVPEDYIVSYDGHTIINTYAPDITQVNVIKSWNDSHNRDNKRPKSVLVQLYANGEQMGSPVTLSEENNWEYTYNNLEKYIDDIPVTYTVDELNTPNQYTKSITNHTNTYIITNTYIPETTNITVHKVWNDSENNDNIRPNSIAIELFADTELYDTVVLNSTNWSYTFTNLPKYYNGKPINYVVYELSIPNGYTVRYDGYTITNTHIPSVTEVEVVKVWDDNHNSDGRRPNSIKVQLYANNHTLGSSVVLSQSNDWKYVYKNLPKYENGQLVFYHVDELTQNSYYTKSITENSHAFIITNTHRPEVTSLTVNKVWNDSNNQDGYRPKEVTVDLFYDGQLYETIKLNSNNNWSYTFHNLPKYYDGKLVHYSVYEFEESDEYTVTYNGTSIINTHIPEVTEVEVIKVWDDNHNRDNTRPDNVMINILADGVIVRNSIMLNKSNNWEYIVTDLPKYHNGKQIVYSVDEIIVPKGYRSSITNNSNVFIITNRHVPETTNITVVKVWNDSDNRDGLRPNRITVELFADGELVDVVVLNSSSWNYTFHNLPYHYNGKEIKYTVYEYGVPEGYVVSYNGLEIINTHVPEVVEVEVLKLWNDNHNRDGIRPAGIKVQLYANGVAMGNSILLSEDNDWRFLFNNLPKYNNSRLIRYTVSEMDVPIGYTSSVSYRSGAFIIKNAHNVERINISIVKVWDDNGDSDGRRPSSVHVDLFADGELVKTVTLTAKNNWTYNIKNMPKYYNGKPINYTLYEVEHTDKYTVTYDGLKITNTYIPEVTEINVIKIWDDNHNQDGKRPNNITIQLYKNGKKYLQPITLNPQNNWIHIYNNLPKYENKKIIQYTIKELKQTKQYTTKITRQAETIIITNTHKPETTNITIQKIWQDNNNQDGIRPKQITIKLYSNGEQIKTITLNNKNNWTTTINNLPKYHNGNPIQYTLHEIEVQGYTTTYNKTTITNTHTPETTNIYVFKVWQDNHNKDKIRPNNITIQLKANGEKIGQPITLNNKNNWQHTYNNLPKYKNGKLIKYTIDEINIPKYYTKTITNNTNTFTITNTHIPENTTKTIKFAWKWYVIGLNGSYENNSNGNHTEKEDYRNSKLIDQNTHTIYSGGYNHIGQYNNYGRYYNRYNRYNPYYRYNNYNRYSHNYNYNGYNGFYKYYRLYIILLKEYLDGNITYEQFIAILDENNIEYFNENGTIVIDYENIEDIPEEITVNDTTELIPSSSDNVDVTNPDKNPEPVIDKGEVKVEVEVPADNNAEQVMEESE